MFQLHLSDKQFLSPNEVHFILEILRYYQLALRNKLVTMNFKSKQLLFFHGSAFENVRYIDQGPRSYDYRSCLFYFIKEV